MAGVSDEAFDQYRERGPAGRHCVPGRRPLQASIPGRADVSGPLFRCDRGGFKP